MSANRLEEQFAGDYRVTQSASFPVLPDSK